MKVASSPINRIEGKRYRTTRRKLTLLIICTTIACSGVAVMILQMKKIKEQEKELQKLQLALHQKDFEILELIDRNDALTDQNKQMREAIEELKDVIDDLNAKRYFYYDYYDYYFDDLEDYY